MTADQSFRFEHRRRSDRTLGLAFAVSIGVHLGAIALYGILHVSPGGLPPEPIAALRERIETVINVAPLELASTGPHTASGQPSSGEAPRGERAGTSMRSAAAGTGVPVPSMDDSLAGSPMVTAVGLIPAGDPAGALERSARSSDRPGRIGSPRAAVSTPVPEPEEILFDGIEPEVDLASLQRSIVYPDAARRNGVEGTVVVKVLVDEQGRAAATRLEHSDSRLLESAAIEAVLRARYTPGTQQGRALPVWIVIPVKFRLQ